jgi:lysophospholipase L1-like esterase
MTSRIVKSSCAALVSNLSLLLGSMVFGLLLGEFLLRLFSGLLPGEIAQQLQANPGQQGVDHPYIGHLHRANSAIVIAGRDFRAVHHTDGHGFRNVWPWPERAEIVAVGDSLTFGHGVDDEQAWPAIVASSLPRSRVINLGLSGAGAQQYLRVYETFGMKLHPKLVLVGFFARNDFWDDGLFDRWAKLNVGIRYMVWRNFGRPKKVGFDPDRPIASIIRTLQWKARLWASTSHLYNLLLYVRGNARNLLVPSEVKIFQSSSGSRLELHVGDFANITTGTQPDRREFQLVLQALQRIQSLARANGTHMLVIFQPSKEETYLSLVGEDVLNPAGPLQEELKKLGIAYLELGPAFRERAAKGEKLFFEVDGHPNARGYALIAELVLSHLKANARKYGLKDWERDSSHPRS